MLGDVDVYPCTGEIRRWLARPAIACPARQGESHDPTPRDVRWAIRHLDGSVVTVAVDGTRWCAMIAGGRCVYGRAWLDAVGFTGDEHLPVHLCFAVAAPLAILRLAERLARRCGALVLIPDDATPAVVGAGADVGRIALGWREWS